MLRKTPFLDGRNPPLLVHCGYHKVGTVWFARILGRVGSRYGLKVQRGMRVRGNKVTPPLPDTGIFIDPHSRAEGNTLPPFKGSHMVRDPRDMVISGYFYHKWTTERWVRMPGRMDGKDWGRSDWRGWTYHDILNSVDQEEGLAIEIHRASAGVLHRINSWDYDDPRFHEMQYRNVIADEDAAFATMFTHYGFTPKAVERSVEMAREFSFKNVTKRDVGEKSRGKSHLRSGQPGEWSQYFTGEHRKLFEEINPGLMVKLGYEISADW